MRAVVLLLLLCVGLEGAWAVTCDSYTSQSSCDGKYTDAGKCAWNSEKGSCFTTDEKLPDGMVGVTSLSPEDIVLVPGPSESGGTVGTLWSPTTEQVWDGRGMMARWKRDDDGTMEGREKRGSVGTEKRSEGEKER